MYIYIIQEYIYDLPFFYSIDIYSYGLLSYIYFGFNFSTVFNFLWWKLRSIILDILSMSYHLKYVYGK